MRNPKEVAAAVAKSINPNIKGMKCSKWDQIKLNKGRLEVDDPTKEVLNMTKTIQLKHKQLLKQRLYS